MDWDKSRKEWTASRHRAVDGDSETYLILKTPSIFMVEK